jgi:hypothetical protein
VIERRLGDRKIYARAILTVWQEQLKRTGEGLSTFMRDRTLVN